MELIEVILSKENLNRAYKKVVANKGAGGVDGVTVEELGDYIRENKDVIVASLRNRTYMPKPVRRVYIPKDNGKKRPLGIPTALDRTIQQAIAQPIADIYEEVFSEYSYGFRPGRSCHEVRFKVSKLSPVDAFKLMGMTKEDAEKAREVGITDAQLYKQAGNGIVTNATMHIMEQLFNAQYASSDECMDGETAAKNPNLGQETLRKEEETEEDK